MERKVETYLGPRDKDVVGVIVAYGTRTMCSYEELMKTYGTHNKMRTDTQLQKMCLEGVLLKEEVSGEIYYRIVNPEST